MTDTLFDEVTWASRERLLSGDLNALASYTNDGVWELFGRLCGISDYATAGYIPETAASGAPYATYGGVIDGFEVSQDSGGPSLNVEIAPGLAVGLWTAAPPAGRSKYRPVYFDTGVITLAIDSPDAVNDRYDVIVVQPAAYNAEQELRDIFNAAGTSFTPTLTYKRIRNLLDASENGMDGAASIRVIKGTAAGSPVLPTIPAYTIPIAIVTAVGGSSTIVDANIDNSKRRLRPHTEMRVKAVIDASGSVLKQVGTGGCSLSSVLNGSIYELTLSGFPAVTTENIAINVQPLDSIGSVYTPGCTLAGSGVDVQIVFYNHTPALQATDFLVDICLLDDTGPSW